MSRMANNPAMAIATQTASTDSADRNKKREHYQRLEKLEALFRTFRDTAEMKMKTHCWSDFEIKVFFRNGLITHFEVGDRATVK